MSAVIYRTWSVSPFLVIGCDVNDSYFLETVMIINSCDCTPNKLIEFLCYFFINYLLHCLHILRTLRVFSYDLIFSRLNLALLVLILVVSSFVFVFCVNSFDFSIISYKNQGNYCISGSRRPFFFKK